MMNFIKWFFAGIGTMILLVVILFILMRDIHAHDVVRINTEDRSVVSNHHSHDNKAVEDMVLVHSSGTPYTRVIPVSTEIRDDWCAKPNAFYKELRRNVDRELELHPEFAYIFEDAYIAIENAWCTQ